MEIAVPLATLKGFLGDPGPAKRYGIFGLTARRGITVHKTDAGYFSFAESKTPPIAPVAAPANALPSSNLLAGGPLPNASIKIDGNFDDWKDVPPVVAGSQDAADNNTISRICLAADAKNLYVLLDIADKTPSSFFHQDNFKDLHQFSYAITIDGGESPENATVRLFRFISNNTIPATGWYVEMGFRKKTFQDSFGRAWNYRDQGNYFMKGSSVEIAVPLDKIKRLLGDVTSEKRYRVRGWTGVVGSQVLEDLRETEAGYFSF